MKLAYHLERLEFDQGVMLLQGWVALDDPAHAQLQLYGRDLQGQEWSQSIAFNRDRPDVGSALGLTVAQQRCGFFYYAPTPVGQVLELRVQTRSARRTLHRWPNPLEKTPYLSGVRLRTWRYLLERSWTLLRNRQWRGFQDRAARHMRSAWQALRMLRRLPDTSHESWSCLVIDHDLGGGANQYRKHQLAQELLGNEGSVALLTFSVLSLRYMVYRILPGQRQEVLAALTWPQLQSWLEQIHVAHIFYNNAVSFPQALGIAEAVHIYKKKHECQLTLAIHDYFSICPSQHLLHANGKYCHLPDEVTCQNCLQKSEQTMVNLYRHHGIAAWRAVWGNLLAVADDVRIFDPSAQAALQRAYPQLSLSMSFRPHQVRALSEVEKNQLCDWQRKKQHSWGRIGIVGSITSEYKGIQPVIALAKTISESGKPYEIIVLGECIAMPGLPLRSTGAYRASELTNLIIEHDIDMFFFSSVGPETFSYVLHELEAYQLPVAAFDLGAQSTFLARYSQAIHLNLADSAEQVLKKIEPCLQRKLH